MFRTLFHEFTRSLQDDGDYREVMRDSGHESPLPERLQSTVGVSGSLRKIKDAGSFVEGGSDLVLDVAVLGSSPSSVNRDMARSIQVPAKEWGLEERGFGQPAIVALQIGSDDQDIQDTAMIGDEYTLRADFQPISTFYDAAYSQALREA